MDLTTLEPYRPSLYRLSADGLTLDFFFAQCPSCSLLTFPANAPGCMHCGQLLDQAERVTRSGDGVLLEYVTLHTALVPGMAAPSIAGDIRIADGIVEEGVIAVAKEGLLAPGMRMRAVAVPMPSGHTYDCRFVPAQEVGA